MSSKRTRRSSTRKSSFSNGAMQASVFRTRITGVPFRVTQTTSGTGGLTTVESSSSLSAANSVALDPYTIGGRLLQFANEFQQYRVVSGKLTYVPDGTATGLYEAVNGQSTTPSYVARPFAIGIFKDPALSTLTYTNIIDGGGKWCNTSRGRQLSIGPSPWLWTSTTAASPSTIDLRTTAFGKLYFAFFNSSTTASPSFGHLILQIDVEYKGVIFSAAPLGSSLSPPQSDKAEAEEKKVVGIAAEALAKSPRTTAAETLIALGGGGPPAISPARSWLGL